MKKIDLEKILARHGVMVTNSHVVYTSGKHGSEYFNKDALYPHTEVIKHLCEALAASFGDDGEKFEAVIGPVTGGIALSQWTAYALSEMWNQDVLAFYADRIPGATPEEDQFVLKRGYDKLIKGKRTLVVEDVLTTGGSVRKVVNASRICGAQIMAVGALCNRGKVTTGMISDPPKLESLWNLDLKAYDADVCPFCKAGIPINTDVGKGKEFLVRQRSGN